MLAFLIGERAREDGLDRRVGSSLGLFAGFAVSAWRDADRIGWQLPWVGALPPRARRTALANRIGLKPALLPGGMAVQVHGWIDNCAELAAELGCPASDQAVVYAHAVKAWGDGADARVLGGYCAVCQDPAHGGLRLARSPLYAPPLYYARIDGALAAVSVPRVLEAMGLPRELNPQRMADSLFFNFNETESYLKGCFKVPYGTVLHLFPDRQKSVQFYDPLAVKAQPKASAEDYVREADRLLEEACQRYARPARKPGVLLTGGLDSSNVAARLLRSVPPGQRVPSFTYVPLPVHGQAEIPGALIDEGPAVRAFCAMHPRIDPHFIDNRDIEYDHRLEDMFLAMGTGTVAAAPFFRYHGLFAAAQVEGCDMLLTADQGNFSISSSGRWGYGEYLRTGRWKALLQALRGEKMVPGSLLRRFMVLAVMPSLPGPLWRATRRLRGLDDASDNRKISALTAAAMTRYSVEERARAAGNLYERTAHAHRKDLIRDNFQRGDVEGSDMIQGWEQLYEISMRDPTNYRPLIDFCLGLPTEMFLRDGQTRWLARAMGRGEMPEAQRTMPGSGQHFSDWHARMTPRRDELRREVAAIAQDPVLSEMIDSAELLASIDDWPAGQTIDEDTAFPRAFRLPRAIAMARYHRFMTGQNRP